MAEAVKPFPNPRDHPRAGQTDYHAGYPTNDELIYDNISVSTQIATAVDNDTLLGGAGEDLTYVHFLFDRHQIVESEGAETESLFTGPEALKTVDSAARVEILHLFPELASIDYDRLPDPVRPILSGRQGRKLANRHAHNKKHLAQ